MLINLRNALMAGKRTPTAKDYVQDGLIAMWDGIENAGWGTHDVSANTWKDLAGGVGDLAVNNGTFNENRYVWQNSKYDAIGSVSQATIDGVITLEVVANAPAPAGTGVSFVTMRGGTGRRKLMAYIVNRRQTETWGSRYGFSFVPTVNVVYTYCGIFIDPARLFVDAAERASTTTNAGWGHDTNNDICFGGYYSGCSIYAVRMYSRALTADEIAANYAIDQERFNLP